MEKEPIVENNQTNDNDDELRVNRGERLIKFLDRINACDFVNNLFNDKESINFEQFKNFLIRIHGIIKDVPKGQRSFDGKNVQLEGFIDQALVPKFEDKEELLKYAFKSLDKVKPGDIKYLLPAIINAVHPFNDGNGRTSRVMYQLLKRYKDKEDFIKNAREAIGKFGRFDSVDVNPGFGHTYLEKIILENNGWEFQKGQQWTPFEYNGKEPIGVATVELRKIKKDENNYKYAKIFFDFLKIDLGYMKTALYQSLSEEKIDQLSTFKYQNKQMISMEKMNEKLTENDWQKIIDQYYKFKKEEVKLLVDGFINPDSVKLPDEELNFRDSFINSIEDNYQENKSLT